jgi:serine/threonine-protein kinase
LWVLRDPEAALAEFLISEKHQPNNVELLKAKARLYETLGEWPEVIATLNKGVELNPRDAYLITELTFVYWWCHMYDRAMTTCHKAISIAPEALWPYMYKANIIWTTSGANEISNTAMQNVPDSHSFWWWMWYWQHIGEGNFELALDLVANAEENPLKNKLYARPKALLSAWIYDYLDESDRASAAYDSARIILEKLVREYPDDPRYHSSLGIAYAGLGMRAEAIASGTKACEILSIATDAVYGVLFASDLAVIYTKTGDHDLALDQLEYLMSIPSLFSTAYLRMDIRFAPLYHYPRFQALRDKPILGETG